MMMMVDSDDEYMINNRTNKGLIKVYGMSIVMGVPQWLDGFLLGTILFKWMIITGRPSYGNLYLEVSIVMGIPRNHPKFDHFRIETVVVGIPLILRNLHWYCGTVLGLYCLRITVVWYNNVIALHNNN